MSKAIVGLLGLFLAASAPAGAAGVVPPLTGFVVHFDFLANRQEARELVRFAASHGAEVINVVPPAHVWESRLAVDMLDDIVDEAGRQNLKILFTRIDAALPSVGGKEREYYLYDHILDEPGRMPDGSPSTRYFLTTAGRRGYAEWMEEETRYYAIHYGRLPNLLGINLGPFSEPFASERGGFLEYMRETDRYELTQYTPEATQLWHEWLQLHYGDIAGVNREYQTSFAGISQVPLPRNELDLRFGSRAYAAYFDFVRTLNDWFVERYERCRRIWHEVSGRDDVPFILQFSGSAAEKLAKARPAAAAFDVAGWIVRADAVGLSLYTNSGYPDYGHASVAATVRLVALARDLDKKVFVLEGGCEAPNVVLDEAELRFIAFAANSLAPQTWIYEFLKDKFNEEYRSNPGKLVRADGSARPAAVGLMGVLFREIQQNSPSVEAPVLAVSVDAMAARNDAKLAAASLALFDLAAMAPVRWTTPATEHSLPAGIPRVRFSESMEMTGLARALLAAPEPGSGERDAWVNEITTQLSNSPGLRPQPGLADSRNRQTH